MVELCRCPAVCCVAIGATEAKATFMRLIFLMTGITILGCCLEIAQPTCIDMTLYTSNIHMPARYFERENIVIKTFPKTIHAIMAIETGGAKRQCMRRHEAQVHLTVTAITDIWSKRCDVTLMTIFAVKRFARNRKLMAL